MAGKDHHGAHAHGTMDITAHEKTFDGFIKMSTRVAIFSICLLIFLALVNA